MGAEAEGRNWHVAVIGAGPAGLYAADALVKRGASVDVFEKEFAPFGLVRYGVAPDHQKIKKTQKVFERILSHQSVRFFGNVGLGDAISLSDLYERYDQVLISIGNSGARRLNISGEELSGSVSSTALVNWYNGHPGFVDAAPDLQTKRAVVVGMGNVAIDVARVLMRRPVELEGTDISPKAIGVLRSSQVDEVVLFARRGPNQAAFDDKELRELSLLDGFEVCVDGYVSKRKTSKSDYIATFPRASDCPAPRRVVLHFCASPVEILGDECVEAVRWERNDLVESAARMKAVGTGEFHELETGLVVRAIGYAGCPVPGVPFCDDTGTVPHREGRVLTEQDGEVLPQLYVAGWIKRGPTGLIGTNKACAVETVAAMEEDLDQVGPVRDPESICRLLDERRVRFISGDDWKLLDAHELSAGEAAGKLRQKLLSLDEALAVLDEQKSGLHGPAQTKPTSTAAG